MNPIVKCVSICITGLGVGVTSLHHLSHAWVKLEDKATSTYQSSKLGRYVEALRSYEDNGTAVVQKADTRILIQSVANIYGVKADLIQALIQVESNNKPDAIGFNPHLEPKYGKMGAADHSLMQVNGQWVNTKMCPEAQTWKDLYKPEVNLTCGTRILADAIRSTKSIEDALVVYNCGKTNCEKGRQYAQKIGVALMNQMYLNR